MVSSAVTLLNEQVAEKPPPACEAFTQLPAFPQRTSNVEATPDILNCKVVVLVAPVAGSVPLAKTSVAEPSRQPTESQLMPSWMAPVEPVRLALKPDEAGSLAARLQPSTFTSTRTDERATFAAVVAV